MPVNNKVRVTSMTTMTRNLLESVDGSSNSLELRFDGANGSTAMIDSSYEPSTFTTVNATISTTHSYDGGSSLYLPGTVGNCIYTAGAEKFTFGAGNFTVEGFIRISDISSKLHTIITNRASTGADYNWTVASNLGRVFMVCWGPTPGATIGSIISPSNILPNTWHHFAVVRNGSSFICYLDGQPGSTLTYSDSLVDSSGHALYIGIDPSVSDRQFSGYIDEIKITKGVARYTEAFDINEVTYTRESYIDATAQKGADVRVVRIPVRLGTPPAQPTYRIEVSPNTYTLKADALGKVESSSYGTAAVKIFKDTSIDTSNWSISRTDPSGISTIVTGNLVSILSMDDELDSGVVTITATKLGASTQTAYLTVNKDKDIYVAGLTGVVGGYLATYTEPSIYFKFKNTGEIFSKYGSGSYEHTGVNWYFPLDPTGVQGANFWINMNYTSDTGDTLTAGTNGVIGPTTGLTWYQMNVDREWYMTALVSPTGRHTVDLLCSIVSSSTGASPSTFNTAKLEVYN